MIIISEFRRCEKQKTRIYSVFAALSAAAENKGIADKLLSFLRKKVYNTV